MAKKKVAGSDGRIYLRAEDGRHQSGSLPLEAVVGPADAASVYYPQHPNVEPPAALTGGEVEESIDLSDGLGGENLRAVGEAVGEISRRALIGAAAVGLVGGVVAMAAPAASAAPTVGVSELYENKAAAQFSERLAVLKVDMTATPTNTKSKACLKAEKKVKNLRKNGAKPVAAKAAQKRVVAACQPTVRSGVPGDPGASWNLDGTVRHSAEWFNNGKLWELSRKELAQAVAGVSGKNWADQSHLPLGERVGYPPGTPDWMMQDTYWWEFMNATPGDVAFGYFTVGGSYSVDEFGFVSVPGSVNGRQEIALIVPGQAAAMSLPVHNGIAPKIEQVGPNQFRALIAGGMTITFSTSAA